MQGNKYSPKDLDHHINIFETPTEGQNSQKLKNKGRITASLSLPMASRNGYV
jgi:hypothetical protein